jgi:cellulose synthase/poly-beta-1,6-N-acetylglucosamine synthase-like glycosyltransferase
VWKREYAKNLPVQDNQNKFYRILLLICRIPTNFFIIHDDNAHMITRREASDDMAEDPSRSRRLDYGLEEKTSSDASTFPHVSIIIPTFNESSNIIKLLKSIFANYGTLGVKQLEVIVVDDDSPDRTANLVERFSREEHTITKSSSIKVVRRQEKKGLSSAILDGFYWHQAISQLL